MRDHPHAFLIELIAMHERAAFHGCGLQPQLLEMLLDRHAALAGTVPLDLRIRSDGPAQPATPDLTGIDRAAQGSEGRDHAQR